MKFSHYKTYLFLNILSEIMFRRNQNHKILDTILLKRFFEKAHILICFLIFILTSTTDLSAGNLSTVIKFDNSSNYNIWIRLKTDQQDHTISLKIDDELKQTKTILSSTTLNWILIGETIWISQGSHKIDIIFDKPDLSVDKIEISMDPGYIPTGNGSEIELEGLSKPVESLVIPLNGNGGYVMVGDLDNNTSIDFIISGIEYISAYSNTGTLLWQEPFSGRQHAQVGWGWLPRPYDIDNDTTMEVISPVVIDGNIYLAAIDGLTGTIEGSILLPEPPEYWYYESSQIANYDGDIYSKFVMIKLVDIRAPYDSFKILTFIYQDGIFQEYWTFERVDAGKGVCHSPIVADIDFDGKDEVLLGHWVLEEDGQIRWEKDPLFFDDELHVDSIRAADIDPAIPGLEIISVSGFMVLDKDGGVIWRKDAYGPLNGEGQSVAIDEFRTDLSGQEILFALQAPDNNEYLYSSSGDLLWGFDGPSEFDASYETTPIQWIGDIQKETLQQYRGRGRTISIFDEYGKFVGEFDPSVKYGEIGYRIANVLGDFREEIICYNQNYLIVYSNSASCPFSNQDPWLNENYRKKQYNWVYY